MPMDLSKRFGSSILAMRQSVEDMKKEDVTDERSTREVNHAQEDAKVIPISAGREKGN